MTDVPIAVAQLLLDTLQIGSEHDAASLRSRWERADRRGVATLMTREGGELWLHRRLVEIGLPQTSVARTKFWRLLEQQARKSAAQNLLVKTHGEYVTRLLKKAGIPHRPIKGLARLAAADAFPFADCRATRDVDLLVPRDAATAAWDCLTGNGYKQSSDLTPTDHFHLPPLANEENIAVEIHTSTSSNLPAEEAWERTVKGDEPTELLWQGVMHAMDQGLEAFFLRYFLDAAVALHRGDAVQWDVVERRLRSPEVADYDRTMMWLLTADEFTSAEIPIRSDSQGDGFPLLRTMAWRVAVYRSRFRNKSWRRKLLAEGLRCDLHLPLEGPVPATPITHKVRRRTSAAAARLMYVTWKRVRWRGRDTSAKDAA